MTRINVGIPPRELSDKHLIAEHREIKRIPNMINSGKARVEGIPAKFTLGTGHVKFFYNKLYYLKRRYLEIYGECRLRGFNVQHYASAWDNCPDHLMNDFNPAQEDIELIRQRIKERS